MRSRHRTRNASPEPGRHRRSLLQEEHAREREGDPSDSVGDDLLAWSGPEDPLVELRSAQEELPRRRWWQDIPRPAPASLVGIAVLVLIGVGAVHLSTQGAAVPSTVAAGTSAPLIADGPTSGAPGAGIESGASGSAGTGGSAPASAGPDTAGSAGAAGSAATPAAAPSAPAVVYVSGAVIAPDVVELPAGARVADALDAVGGPAEDADLSLLNLARLVVDGEQIHVPAQGEAPRDPVPAGSAGTAPGSPGTIGSGTASAAAGSASASGGLIDINSASAQELQELPGVGPAIAERIVRHRETNGPFASVDGLDEVSGIGPATLEKIREKATV